MIRIRGPVRGAAGVLATVVATALLLAGCSGLPTSGTVTAGLATGEQPVEPAFELYPDGPQPDASPEQIIIGFISAAGSPDSDWLIARQFLAQDAEWRPKDGVTIYDASTRVIFPEEETVELTLGVTGYVDGTGAYRAGLTQSTELSYSLVQEDGQWRISVAPEGIVIDEGTFTQVFQPYRLMFFDPSWSRLIPDVRWFPRRNVATQIVEQLVEGGPSPWLLGAVESAFPEDVELDGAAVPIDSNGVARVNLSEGAAAAQPLAQSRMLRQVRESLRSARISDAEIVVDGARLAVDPAPVQTTTGDTTPIVRADDQVGLLTPDGLTVLPGDLSPALAALPTTSLALGSGQGVAATLLADGTVARVNAEAAVQVVDDRSGMIAPAIDTEDAVWSVPRDQPAGLRATGADGVPVAIAGAWPTASQVHAFAISPDGVRVAAVVTEGGQEWLVSSAIRRDGTTVSLGTTERIAHLDGTARDLAWLDDETIGVVVVGDGSTRVLSHMVGGLGATVAAPSVEIVDIAAGASVATPRLLSADGEVFTRRGATWSQSATKIQVLGSVLGSR